MNPETKGYALGLLGVIAFGLTLPFTRHIVPYFDPSFIGLGRGVMAGMAAGLILLVMRKRIPTVRQLCQLLVVTLGVVIGFPLFSAWAMLTVPASHGGVVLGLLPLATACASILVTDERPSLAFWLCALVGSTLVICYSLLDSPAGHLQSGDLLLLVAIMCAAMGYAMGGKLSKQLGGWQVICWACVISLPLVCIPVWLTQPASYADIPSGAWWSFLYLGLISQLIAFFAWYKGMALGGVTRISQLLLLQSFITIIASALIIDERIGAITVIFALLVTITVAASKRMPIYSSTNPK